MTKSGIKYLSKALKNSMDRISDCFIIIDENNSITEFNSSCTTLLSNNKIRIKRKNNILEYFKILGGFDVDIFKDKLNNAIKIRELVSFEFEFECGEILEIRVLIIEFVPIIINDKYVGAVIIFKDITRYKNNLKKIEEQNNILIEKERLASIGALIGGISHNLKTPILAIKGCLLSLKDLSDELFQSIENKSVIKDDYSEIAKEMKDWMGDIKKHHKYIYDSINTVKDQTIKTEMCKIERFTIKEVISGIDFLMKHELIINECQLLRDINVKNDVKLLGNRGIFLQIINNIISNSIQDYKNNNLDNRKIELNIFNENEYIYFKIKDYAGGIQKNIQKKLFKEMVTSKGRNGTGIGLLLSYTRINEMFNGKIWYESEVDIGTTFFIKIPIGE